MQPAPFANQAEQRLERILSQNHTLCKEDVIWVLDFVKKKIAEHDPRLTDLSQPRLLKNFHYFAEVAMFIIHRRPSCGEETERLRTWLAEATFGLRQ